ncbi:MAG: SMI1/KNR4 family protein [Myxococcales bacterium]|nr:SMI1/KNR4 family protein [Myxococcales bacterium]
MAAKKKVIPTVEATLSALSESPPKGKQKGAKSFKKLEALTAIPDGLRELWTWSNGFSRMFLRNADYFTECTDDLYSVDQAATVLKRNLEAGMDPQLLPFGGEAGSGDSLVLHAKTGRVLYWDHEEGEADAGDPVAKSLDELLARSAKLLLGV